MGSLLPALSSAVPAAIEYFLLGLAFSIAYAIGRVFNLVLAASYFLGALAGVVISLMGGASFFAHIAVAILLAIFGGALCMAGAEVLLLKRLRLRSADSLLILLATFGLYLIVANAGLILLHSQIVYPAWIAVRPAKDILGLRLTDIQFVELLVAVLCAALWKIFRTSALGFQMRLLEGDYVLASLTGVDSNKLVMVVSAIAGAVMGIAGFFGSVQSGVDASIGFVALFPAIVVALVAGAPNAGRLAIVAGGLAVVEALVVVVAGQQWRSSVAYVALAAVLAVFRLAPTKPGFS